MTNIPDRLLHSLAETRALLGDVPPATFDLWIKQGIIKPIRIGTRRSFVRHDDLIALVESATLPKVG